MESSFLIYKASVRHCLSEQTLIITEVLMLILIRITNYFIATVHLRIKVIHFLADKFLSLGSDRDLYATFMVIFAILFYWIIGILFFRVIYGYSPLVIMLYGC